MDSTDSRPASLRCPESRNTDDEIQVSFPHAEPALNLNERFTQYRERTRSVIQNSQDSDVVGKDQDSGMVPLTPRRPQIGAHTRGIEFASQTDCPRQSIDRTEHGLDFPCDDQRPGLNDGITASTSHSLPQYPNRGRPLFTDASMQRGRTDSPKGRDKGQGRRTEYSTNSRGHDRDRSAESARGREFHQSQAPRQGANRKQLIVCNSDSSQTASSQRDQVSSKRDKHCQPNASRSATDVDRWCC